MKIRSKRDAGEAIQWTGKNTSDVMAFVGDEWSDGQGTWLKQKWNGDGFEPDYFLVIHHDEVILAEGDWLIKSLGGDLRAVQEKDFAEAYEPTP
jgi:hypothetical protein